MREWIRFVSPGLLEHRVTIIDPKAVGGGSNLPALSLGGRRPPAPRGFRS